MKKMAVEGLKRIYETPFIKARVDIVKEQPREEGEKKQRKKKKKKLTELKKERPSKSKGIIDIRA
jgi:hypothetical protein